MTTLWLNGVFLICRNAFAPAFSKSIPYIALPFKALSRAFHRPFTGLSVVMWLLFVACYLLYSNHPTWTGNLPDPDDYTYLTQTLDWIHGQSWFDSVQHRMNPPEGVLIHFSRLTQLPIAAFILLFRALHFSWNNAALHAAFVLPFVYLGVLFWVLNWVTGRFVSPNWSRFSAFVAMFSFGLISKFAPGQIDHHNLEIILSLCAVGFAAQMFARPYQKRWGMGAAGFLALAMNISLECLPWLLLISTIIGLWSIFAGKKAAASAIAYGLALVGFGSLLLIFTRPMSAWLSQGLMLYSITYVLLMGAIAVSLIVSAGLSVFLDTKRRFILSVAAAFVLAVLFFHQYPALLQGPYGAMDQQLEQLFKQNLSEMQPLIERWDPLKLALYIVLPVVAFVVCLISAYKADPQKRWAWILVASLILLSLGLCVFYQCRMTLYLEGFMIIPLVLFVERVWQWIGENMEGRRRFLTEMSLLCFVGPLFSVFIIAFFDNRPFNTGFILFPVQINIRNCPLQGVETYLSFSQFEGRKLRIMNMIDQGAELLFSTPHEVISGPYHMNVKGNLNAVEFFRTSDPGIAKSIADEYAVDVVAVCRHVLDMYMNDASPLYYTLPNGNMVKKLPGGQVVDLDNNESFVWQIASGNLPPWLKPIFVPPNLNYALYEVVR